MLLQYNVWKETELLIHAANLETRDSDPEATLEADQKAIESFLNQSMLHPESYEHQHKQEQHTAALPRDHLKGIALKYSTMGFLWDSHEDGLDSYSVLNYPYWHWNTVSNRFIKNQFLTNLLVSD